MACCGREGLEAELLQGSGFMASVQWARQVDSCSFEILTSYVKQQEYTQDPVVIPELINVIMVSWGVGGRAGNSCSGGPTTVMTERRDSWDQVLNPEIAPEETPQITLVHFLVWE